MIQRYCRLALLALAALAGSAAAQDAPVLPHIPSHRVALALDTGAVAGTGALGAVIARLEVSVPDAAWLRLEFGAVRLAGDPAADGAIIRLTSAADGAVQTLDAESLAQWGNTSAYFNGDRVIVELISRGAPGKSRVGVAGATAGDWVGGVPLYGARSICGPTDDRVLSSEPGNARLMPIGCTAWLFEDFNRTFSTAGHCGPAATSVCQFNVPLSNADGTLVAPPPIDQYAVEFSSKQGVSGGTGNDWSYFGCFPNSTSGLTPHQAQNAAYTLAPAIPPMNSQPIRVTGYGTTALPVSRTWNQVQKTHAGEFFSVAGSLVRYRPDTTGGNSGSPVTDTTTGLTFGIHTHAGCNSTGGSNQGTGLSHAGWTAARANPLGVCRSGIGTPTGMLLACPDLNNNFGAVNQAGAGFARIARVVPGVQGLAFNAVSQRVYAVTTARGLYEINPDSGSVQSLGTLTGTTAVLNGLAFNPATQTLYAIAQAGGQLFTVNPAALTVSAVGSPGGGTVGALEFLGDQLLGLSDITGGTRLVRIDGATGVQTTVGALGTGITDCNGLAWMGEADRVYTINSTNGQLLRINPATGAATLVGPTTGMFGAGVGMTGRTPPPDCGPLDYNHDGNADQNDVADLIDVIAGGPVEFDPDLNGDGNADQGDVEYLINRIAGGGC